MLKLALKKIKMNEIIIGGQFIRNSFQQIYVLFMIEINISILNFIDIFQRKSGFEKLQIEIMNFT